jgi:lambda family phage tail tape measure protein
MKQTLPTANASARASNQAELTGYGQGSRMRERMQEMLRIREEFQHKNVDLQRQFQAGDISEDLFRQELALNKRYLDERLRDQEGTMLHLMPREATGQPGCVRALLTGQILLLITPPIR